HAELVRRGHVERRVPGGRSGEEVGMPQQQRKAAPARLAEAEQQSARRTRYDRVGAFDERHDDLEEVGFLPQQRIGRMVAVPGPVGERRHDEDDAELVVQVELLDLQEPVAPPGSVAGLDGKNVDDRILLAGFHLVRRENEDLRLPLLVWRLDFMDEEPIAVPRRLRFAPLAGFLESDEVVVLEKRLLADDLEARGRDFANEHLLAGPDMAHRPVTALSLDPLEVDEHELPAGTERVVDRLE